MSQQQQQQQKVFRIWKHEGIDNLQLTTLDVPKPKRGQVLVRIHAVSLNYRDIFMVNQPKLPNHPIPDGLIPVSDCAGEIVELGEDVTEFRVGDRVCGNIYQKWIGGPVRPEYFQQETLGGTAHGVLCQYRAFDKTSLVKVPANLSYEEASTLPCAGLTAWHAIAENTIQSIGPEHTVLVLGTGGVSVFCIQFALAAGARVIVTSSSDEKLETIRSLGVKDVINYDKNPDWEQKVLELTNGEGVDHVLELGGAGTLPRSIRAVRHGGIIHMIGMLTQVENFDIVHPILMRAITIRGFQAGSLYMFQSMNRAIEINDIHPLIDKVFDFDQAKEAYKYLDSRKHVGKIVIRVD